MCALLYRRVSFENLCERHDYVCILYTWPSDAYVLQIRPFMSIDAREFWSEKVGIITTKRDILFKE